MNVSVWVRREREREDKGGPHKMWERGDGWTGWSEVWSDAEGAGLSVCVCVCVCVLCVCVDIFSYFPAKSLDWLFWTWKHTQLLFTGTHTHTHTHFTCSYAHTVCQSHRGSSRFIKTLSSHADLSQYLRQSSSCWIESTDNGADTHKPSQLCSLHHSGIVSRVFYSFSFPKTTQKKKHKSEIFPLLRWSPDALNILLLYDWNWNCASARRHPSFSRQMYEAVFMNLSNCGAELHVHEPHLHINGWSARNKLCVVDEILHQHTSER